MIPKGVEQTERPAGKLTRRALRVLAERRVSLPDVPLRFDYQRDVDTLCVLFDAPLSKSEARRLDDFSRGLVGIYDGRELVGVEILDATGRMSQANPR